MARKEWIDLTEEQQAAHLQAVKRYDEEHTTNLHLKLNTKTDQDIIKWLWKQRSKQGAIKQLIRKAIAEEDGQQPAQ